MSSKKKAPLDSVLWLGENSAEEIRGIKTSMWREMVSFAVLSVFLAREGLLQQPGELRDSSFLSYFLLTLLALFLHVQRTGNIGKFRERLGRVYDQWGKAFQKLRDPKGVDIVAKNDGGDWTVMIAGLIFYIAVAYFTMSYR